MEYLCNDCPRRCNALRTDTQPGGFCASPALPRVIRAAPHFGEEPCISGTRGAGTVFFCGCNLRCVFCQNREISQTSCGKTLSVPQLRDLFCRLRDQGVHNIDLVTPGHFVRAIAQALDGLELGIPVVWNSSAYESVETLRRLEGLVQVYMPDLKYWKAEPARRYSAAADYPQTATAAIREMVRQRGPYVLDEEGILQSGVLIRHLILPGQDLAAMDVMDFAAESFPHGSVLFSLMSQYTPMPGLDRYPELSSPISPESHASLCSYLQKSGLEGYWQDPDSATQESIPDFDYTGLDRTPDFINNTSRE